MPLSGSGSLAPNTPVQDLRSNAADRKRDIDTKAKWNPRWAATGVPTVKEGPNGTKRPRQLRSQKAATQGQLYGAKRIQGIKKANKQPAFRDDDDTSADRLGDRDVGSGSFYDDQDQDVEDSITLPANGNVVLFMALDQAEQRYEDQVTTKLITNEYEVLSRGAEKKPIFDDDFELV